MNMGRLTPKELVYVLRRAFMSIQPWQPDDPEDVPGHFVLATASQNPDDQSGSWKIELVAHPDASAYSDLEQPELELEEELCQYGACDCGAHMHGTHKRSLCPVCGADVYLT